MPGCALLLMPPAAAMPFFCRRFSCLMFDACHCLITLMRIFFLRHDFTPLFDADVAA